MTDLSTVKEEIKKTANIIEVIGQYVQLKKRGLNYSGLCPFHSEKSPSFTVNEEKQIFHCFGCQKGGDVFTFLMEYHNISFFQSLKDLAEHYNIPLPQNRNFSAERKKSEIEEQLFEVNEHAAEYFHHVLIKSHDGKPGKDYFSKRNLTEETISLFRLGYAINKWDGLTRHLRSINISPELGLKAGLLVSKDGGKYYDRFRGRIIFPIININSRIIGFGGRILDNSLPKYINSPETPIYHKGESLYGLDSASKNIRGQNQAIIVEGYMDLLVLRQHGFSNVVATLGTALTGNQIRRLKGYSKHVIVLFDADNAGRLAAMKSFPLFLKEGLSAKVLVLPDNEDPDSFVNNHGSEEFEKLLKTAAPIFDFYLDQVIACMDDGVDGRIKTLKEVVPLFLDIEQKAVRLLYVKEFSEKTGISEAIVWEELKHQDRDRPERSIGSRLKDNLIPARNPKKYGSDLQFLALLVHYPETIKDFSNKEWELIVSDPEITKIVKVLMEQFSSGKNLDRVDEFLDSDTIKGEFRKISLSRPPYTKESVGQAISEFIEKIARVKISESYKIASASGDLETLNSLIKEKRTLCGIKINPS